MGIQIEGLTTTLSHEPGTSNLRNHYTLVESSKTSDLRICSHCVNDVAVHNSIIMSYDHVGSLIGSSVGAITS